MTQPAISPTPRPLKKAPIEDPINDYRERMREAVKPFYAELVAAGEDGVALAGRPELLDMVGFLRSKGVRVHAKMRESGTAYVLETPPSVTPNTEGTEPS